MQIYEQPLKISERFTTTISKNLLYGHLDTLKFLNILDMHR